MSRIGVIGSGISGLTAAWLLCREHEVWVLERDARIGGHTHTVTTPKAPLPLNTDFIGLPLTEAMRGA
jgi:hypothetical protein